MKQLGIVDRDFKGLGVFIDDDWTFSSEPHPKNTD